MTHADRIETVVVVGGGVAGSTAANLLARSGRTVYMFDSPTRIDPMIGESLLPSVVPILQRLGLEEDLVPFSVIKPGLSFVLRNGRRLTFNLRELGGKSTAYSYNVPRPKFDDLLRRKAGEQGARLIEKRAVVRIGEDGRILIDDESRAAAGLRWQPDLIVDATGRAQLFRRVMGGTARAGMRSDLSLFAHYRNVDLGAPGPGYAVISPLAYGWCWRIPLQERMSVGVVMNKRRWRDYGSDAEKRLERVLRCDPIMGAAMADAEQLSDARSFSNYQYQAERFFGKNWVALGDAAGFVDPTLSPGVLLALQSATDFVDALARGDRRLSKALAQWEARCKRRLRNWEELVGYFYDGSLFAMILQGEDYSKEMPLLRPISRHMERSIGAALLGVRTTSVYHLGLIRFVINKMLARYQPSDWAIR